MLHQLGYQSLREKHSSSLVATHFFSGVALKIQVVRLKWDI